MKRISAAEYVALQAQIKKPKKPKRQQETLNQKDYIQRLNAAGLGFFYRIKSTGTFDPIRRTFRKNSELVGLPDIAGFTFNDRQGVCLPVYIEVKLVKQVEKRRKILFKVKITNEQKDFLLKAYRAGCRAGVAFNYYDAIGIATGDMERYPRHPRTFCFLPQDELEAYAEEFKRLKHEHYLKAQDPVIKEVSWAARG